MKQAERHLRRAVSELDPEVLEAKSAARLVEAFARMERLCAAGKALAARRMALTPDAGAVVVAALESFKERIFAEARTQGRREPYDAYAADALVALAEHGRTCDKTRRARPPGRWCGCWSTTTRWCGATCATARPARSRASGRSPRSRPRALAKDSFLAALVTDGIDIHKVSHMGRTVTARQRTALEVRDPCCVVPGCDVRHHLEIDHITGRKDSGPTKLANLGRLCPWHHYLKTYKGWVLSGGPGKWSLDPPDKAGPDPPDEE